MLQAGVLYSGADDCTFKSWDSRVPDSDGAAALFSNRKTHTAGVTTISSHPTAEHLLLTGSYDEHIRCWDSRNPSCPLLTTQVGPVRRLPWGLGACGAAD